MAVGDGVVPVGRNGCAHRDIAEDGPETVDTSDTSHDPDGKTDVLAREDAVVLAEDGDLIEDKSTLVKDDRVVKGLLKGCEVFGRECLDVVTLPISNFEQDANGETQ